MTHPWFAASEIPRVLAHRGLVTAGDAAHGVVENSFAAVAAARAAGVVYVESDCHLTRDGVVVLFHDEDLRRVVDDPRRVADVTVAELDAVMAAHGGLITLAQALEAFPDLRFNLDMKVAGVAESAGRIVAEHPDRVLLASFSDRRRRSAVAAVAAFGTDVVPAQSAGTVTVAAALIAVWLRSRGLLGWAVRGIDALQIPERRAGLRLVTPRLVSAAHDVGVEVHVWTVNDPGDMRRLLAMGVDGLVTDRADVALGVVAGWA